MGCRNAVHAREEQTVTALPQLDQFVMTGRIEETDRDPHPVTPDFPILPQVVHPGIEQESATDGSESSDAGDPAVRPARG